MIHATMNEIEFTYCAHCDDYSTHLLLTIRDAKPEESQQEGAKAYDYECGICENIKTYIIDNQIQNTHLNTIIKMEEFKVGDTVKLKSGGPKMTIEKLYQNKDEQKSATCIWFVESEKKRADFFVSTLQKSVDTNFFV